MKKLRFTGKGAAPHIPGVKVERVDDRTVETDNPEALLATGQFSEAGASMIDETPTATGGESPGRRPSKKSTKKSTEDK